MAQADLGDLSGKSSTDSELLFWLPLALPRWAGEKKNTGSLVKPCISETREWSKVFLLEVCSLASTREHLLTLGHPVVSLPVPNLEEISRDRMFTLFPC